MARLSGLREYLAGIRIGLPVTKLAKWITGFQMGALGTPVAGNTSAAILPIGFLPVSIIGETMLWVAAALTPITGWDYLTAGLRHAAMPAGSGQNFIDLAKQEMPEKAVLCSTGSSYSFTA